MEHMKYCRQQKWQDYCIGTARKMSVDRRLQDNSPTNQLVVSQVTNWITRG